MSNFKLKVEKVVSEFETSMFCSFCKTGVLKKYQATDDNMNFSYAIVCDNLDKASRGLSFNPGDSLYIDEFFIQENKRGTNYSKELMTQIIDFSKKQNKSILYLYANEKWCNTPFSKLENFYKKTGFVRVNNTNYFEMNISS